jgi:AcrR family transcriptional regulator
MARTRAGILVAAVRLVAERGTRHASMADLARAAGIAKGTLYNHFRTRDDVWAGVVEAELAALVEECHGRPLAGALAHAAQRVSTHPALRRLAAEEPAVLAALATPVPDCHGWALAAAAVTDALAAAGRDRAGADLVLRWLASYLTRPDDGLAGGTAALLVGALPPAPVTVSSHSTPPAGNARTRLPH